jgi:hypothetical protein
MISFNCKAILTEELNTLLKISQKNISKIHAEIDYINTLLTDAPSMHLETSDLLFYSTHLSSMLEDNKKLLHSLLFLHLYLNRLSHYYLEN